MARHEEYMSEKYSEDELDEIRKDMKKTLESIYNEHGNVNIEVCYLEQDDYRRSTRRDTMWRLSELLNSFDGEHDLLYFSDLEKPTETFPCWEITYHAAWEEYNIKYEKEREEERYRNRRFRYKCRVD